MNDKIRVIGAEKLDNVGHDGISPKASGNVSLAFDSRILEDEVLLVGGYVLEVGTGNVMNTSSVLSFNIKNKTYTEVTNLSFELAGCGTLLYEKNGKKYLFCFGGQDDMCGFSMDISTFDFSSREWKPKSLYPKEKSLNGLQFGCAWFTRFLVRNIKGRDIAILFCMHRVPEIYQVWDYGFVTYDIRNEKFISFEDLGVIPPPVLKCEKDDSESFCAGCYLGNVAYVMKGPNPERIKKRSEEKIRIMKYDFDNDVNDWETVETFGIKPPNVGMTMCGYLDRFLVAWGGYGIGVEGEDLKDEKRNVCHIYILDVSTSRWTACKVVADFILHRNSREIIVVNDDLFVYGGESFEPNDICQDPQDFRSYFPHRFFFKVNLKMVLMGDYANLLTDRKERISYLIDEIIEEDSRVIQDSMKFTVKISTHRIKSLKFLFFL